MNTNSETYHSYLDMYQHQISPKLQDIDLLLKTSTEPISVYIAAELLDMAPEEILAIMHQLNVNNLTPENFLKLMGCGSSELCMLYRRELDCGSPYTYTAQDISYIYNIELGLVKASFSRIQASEITAATLPVVLSQIPILHKS